MNCHQLTDRRAFLSAGSAALMGLNLPGLLQAESNEGISANSDRSVILLWMRGGPSQHETWDPKPEAPIEYRGGFGARETSVPGIQIVDLMPQCAAIQHK